MDKIKEIEAGKRNQAFAVYSDPARLTFMVVAIDEFKIPSETPLIFQGRRFKTLEEAELGVKQWNAEELVTVGKAKR